MKINKNIIAAIIIAGIFIFTVSTECMLFPFLRKQVVTNALLKKIQDKNFGSPINLKTERNIRDEAKKNLDNLQKISSDISLYCTPDERNKRTNMNDIVQLNQTLLNKLDNFNIKNLSGLEQLSFNEKRDLFEIARKINERSYEHSYLSKQNIASQRDFSDAIMKAADQKGLYSLLAQKNRLESVIANCTDERIPENSTALGLARDTLASVNERINVIIKNDYKKLEELEKERAQLEKERAQLEKERAQLEKERAQIEKERAQIEKEGKKHVFEKKQKAINKQNEMEIMQRCSDPLDEMTSMEKSHLKEEGYCNQKKQNEHAQVAQNEPFIVQIQNQNKYRRPPE